MALCPDYEGRGQPKPHPNLRESAIRKLVEQGRAPCLLAYEGTVELEEPVCFIPASKSQPARKINVSFEEAARIAAIRDALQRES